MDLAEVSRRGNLEALGNIAERQEGYFSAAQAAAAGIERNRLQRLARQGERITKRQASPSKSSYDGGR